jgi:hypothetical protein
MTIYRPSDDESARPFSLAAPKCDWKVAFLSDVRARVLQRATDVGFANRDSVLLAAVRAFDFDGAPPAGPETVMVRLDAGRCSLIGVGANEKKRDLETLLIIHQREYRAKNARNYPRFPKRAPPILRLRRAQHARDVDTFGALICDQARFTSKRCDPHHFAHRGLASGT